MQCQEIMSRRVRWVSEQDSARTAARIMRDEHVGFLPVRDPSGRAVGTITDRDIATRLVAEDWPAGTPVADIMTHEVVSCFATDDIARAEQLMRTKRKNRVLCLDEEGHVVGVLSLADVALHDDGWRTASVVRQIARRDRAGREEEDIKGGWGSND